MLKNGMGIQQATPSARTVMAAIFWAMVPMVPKSTAHLLQLLKKSTAADFSSSYASPLAFSTALAAVPLAAVTARQPGNAEAWYNQGVVLAQMIVGTPVDWQRERRALIEMVTHYLG